MREIVKVRAASNGEITVAIPRDIRAVVPLKAGDKVLLTARAGEIIVTPETAERPKKRRSEIARTAVKAREEKRKRKA